MDPKVGKAFTRVVVAWIADLSRSCGLNRSPMPRGEMVSHSIFPPKVNNDILLSTPAAVPKIDSRRVCTELVAHDRQASGNASPAMFIASIARIPGSVIALTGGKGFQDANPRVSAVFFRMVGVRQLLGFGWSSGARSRMSR
jgi:hypothetical protein